MNAIDPIYVSIFFAVATLIKLRGHQIENAFSRGLIALWYFYLFANPFVNIETQRLVGRFCIMFLAFIEILSFIFRSWMGGQYKRAMGKLNNDK